MYLLQDDSWNPLTMSSSGLHACLQHLQLLSQLSGLLGTQLFDTHSLLLLGMPSYCIPDLSLCLFCCSTWGPVTHYAGKQALRASVSWELGSPGREGFRE